MRCITSFSVLAAASLVGAVASAQSVAPPNTPSASVMRATPNPELNGPSTAARSDAPRMAAAAHAVLNGMQVKSESGDLLGTVASIVPADSRNDSYVVVADAQNMATVMPLSAASAMVQNRTLVVDKTRFQKAPKMQNTQAEDDTRDVWQQKADSYWKRSNEGGAIRR